MRKAATAAALLLALTVLPAAKPVPPDDLPGGGAERLVGQAWRTRGVPVCVAELRAVRAFSPDDLESICGCTFDTYLEGRGTASLPPVANDRVPAALRSQLFSCTARTRPDQAGAVARLGMAAPAPPPSAALPGADAPKPVGDGPPAESRESDESGGGFGDWVGSLTLPAWLTGAPALLWVALGILVFGLLVLKVRRRDPRRDLMGPPSSMPQRPRRPDLPR